jgi:hemoglobin-like flavoprotein
MNFDFVAVFTSLSKSYREMTNKAHEEMIEAWVKAEKSIADNFKFVSFWKK